MDLSMPLTGGVIYRRYPSLGSISLKGWQSSGFINCSRFAHSSWKNSLTKQMLFLDSKRNHLKVLCNYNFKTSLVEARSMEEVYDNLTKRLLEILENAHDSSTKYLVGIAGPPGAGKSTIASEVVRKLNCAWSQRTAEAQPNVDTRDIAVVLPMDGFHLYRSQLDAMENPAEAHARRGAPWTFDPALLLKCLQTLKNQGSVSVPSFDHGVGDPVEEDIHISHRHKIVIVEGNYLFLEDEIWEEISYIFNEKWFVDIDVNKAMQRVLKRHISTGKAPDVAKWRIEYNDRPNAELIMKSKKNADIIIKSIEKEC